MSALEAGLMMADDQALQGPPIHLGVDPNDSTLSTPRLHRL